MMSLHRLYGLNVGSDVSLPVPPAKGPGKDMAIRWLGPAPRLSTPPPSWTRRWESCKDGWLLRYVHQDGRFLEFSFAGDGASISISHCCNWQWQDFLSILLGPGMASALYLRNIPCLHGSSVILNNRAILLLGDSGVGKSTLTAALVSEGFPLLCDELTALVQMEEGLFLLPGHPLLKLTPRTLEAIGETPEAWPRAFPVSKYTDERWLDVRSLPCGFHEAPAPLGAVYILAGRSREIRSPHVLPIPPSEACLLLGSHFYGSRWLERSPEEILRLCSLIAGTVPVRRVRLPDVLDSVGQSARILAEDALHAVTNPFHRFKNTN